MLFTTIGIAASDFFSVNLSTISNILGLSQSLAGVTFLALGNGSPDVFSTFAAMGSNSASMAVGELIGAASFITAVVAGSMALVREFKVGRRTYVRDICFFIVAVIFTMCFLADGHLHLWECIVMIVYYIFYVFTAITPELTALLSKLRTKVAIGTVGGSDLRKQQEQLGDPSRTPVTSMFDFNFAENGLVAYKLGAALPANSFLQWIGNDQYKELVNFILHYVADLDIPVKRGTFVEFRNGMVNVSPVGRNASAQERADFEAYDKIHGIRAAFIDKLRERFAHLGLTYSIGGQLSFDVFPQGWDKTYCLKHLDDEARKPGGIEYTTIHFFGDKTA
ncbi:hypothetical protein BN1708_017086, partial [Verticillium longisporum]